MYELHFVATTAADWAQSVELINPNTNRPLDLDVASFDLAIEGRRGHRELSASTAEGTITRPQPHVIQWRFTEDQMDRLRGGESYRVGCTMTTGGGTIQLFTGTLAVVDGVVSR